MRLAGRGVIDRSRQVPFRFDGQTYLGFRGDTIASALLAHDVRLVGRSFKYHRPRGILTAGSEEPNALVELHRGDQITPNVRATVQELHRGIDARSQNNWPSVKFDLLAGNDLLAPFLGAGFYYKTFMWPKSFWERVYEPFIRRAAGLGALSGNADTDRHEKAFAHCDLLVIGAGPAGLVAALTAGRAGADVILADEDFLPGGRLNSETELIDGQPGPEWARLVAEELSAMPNVRVMTRTTVLGAWDGGTYGALERVSEHLDTPPDHAPLDCFWRIAARAAILCAGATERPIAFANNDRPGVMLAGAVRSYTNRFGVAPGKRVAVFTNNDDGWQTARDLRDAGVEVAAVIDPRADIPDAAGLRVMPGGQVTGTKGRQGLSGISVRTTKGVERIAVDCLAVSGGWNPAVHLTCHTGARPVWRDDIAAFVPADNAVPGLRVAGAANGNFSTHACLTDGAAAAQAALGDLGVTATAPDIPRSQDAPTRIQPLWHVSGTKGRAWLDFQNDVTVKDVKLAHQENFRSVEHMKRYTTLGMATDQGKTANVGALAVMAELTGQTIPETGTTTFRPPYTAAPIAAIGAGAAGMGFAPRRLTTSHDWSEARGAPFIEAGLWYRPSWFPAPGETHWRQSCDREVNMVRNSVGVTDVSTLGKIDVQGPDAAAFLDRVYAGTMSTLKVGRVRYGLMLREDGHVMDDGTCARLADDHYLISTTTAAAGVVMTHMEFCLQVLWPELDAQVISVTEQYAQFAVAGPKAVDLLDGIIDGGLAGDALPFMGWADVTVGGVAARLFRISFSGETGFELAVPARFGACAMDALVARAQSMGGGVYGMEALNVLRIEKGFITHAEIDGRVTAADAGLGGMVSKKKDFIGRWAANRPGLTDPDRKALVGIRPVGAVKQLLAGAHLYDLDAQPVRTAKQGYVTSVCYSPMVNSMIGLAFVKGGPARLGEQVKMVDHLRGVETLVELCSPVFFDADGGRMRG